MSRMAIATSRKLRRPPVRLEPTPGEPWPGCDLGALEETIEIVLHYRDRHVAPRGGCRRAEPCMCPSFGPTRDVFRCAVHAEVLSAIRKGELPDLLRTLRTLSSDPRLRAKDPYSEIVTAAA